MSDPRQSAEPPTDTTAAIEMWARLLNAADVHVYGDTQPVWRQLQPAAQDEYRKAARWLMGRVIMPPEVIRAKVFREALDIARAEGTRLEEHVGTDAARGARCVAYLLRKKAEGEER